MYTLMIMVVIGSSLGMLIFLNGLQGNFRRQTLDPIWAKHNLESGVLSYLNKGFQPNQRKQLVLFGNKEDSCLLQTEFWGLLGLIHAKGTYHHATSQASILVGQGISEKNRFALSLKDGRSSLSVAGPVVLEGKAFLPTANLRALNIPGYSYQANTTKASILSSRDQSFRPNWQQIEHLKDLLSNLRSWTHSSQVHVMNKLEISQPWNQAPKLYQSASSLIMQQCILKGKVLIVADAVVVKASSHLEHCLIITKRLTIEHGFEGTLQAFALEKVEVGESVTLTYPSVLGLLPDQANPVLFTMGTNSTIEGEVLISRDPFRTLPHRNDRCTILEGASIWGSLYCSQMLDIRGAVYGRVIADELIYRSPVNFYKNTVAGGKFYGDDLSTNFVGGIVYSDEPYQIIEWLGE